MRVLVMGVAGAGKTTLARALAGAAGFAFVDADDHHDEAARAAMAVGRGLTEAERAPWLDRVAAAIAREEARTNGVVLACSALKAAHRARIAPDLILHLAIDEAEVAARLAARRGHYAGPSLAASQFLALEAPDDAVSLDASRAPGDLLADALAAVRALDQNGRTRRLRE